MSNISKRAAAVACVRKHKGSFKEAALELGVTRARVWQLAHDDFPRGSIQVRRDQIKNILNLKKNSLATNEDISYTYDIKKEMVKENRIKLLGIKDICKFCKEPIKVGEPGIKYHRECYYIVNNSRRRK